MFFIFFKFLPFANLGMGKLYSKDISKDIIARIFKLDTG